MTIAAPAKVAVTVYKVECSLCGVKIHDVERERVRAKLSAHLDEECKIAKRWRQWEKEGVFQDMIHILRLGALENELRGWMRKRRLTVDRTRELLDSIEEAAERSQEVA